MGSEMCIRDRLIYGSLTPDIRNPLSFAVSRTLETGINAGGPAARLASLPPHELASLLLRTQKRLEGGYLGWSQLPEAGAEDLNALLLSLINISEPTRPY